MSENKAFQKAIYLLAQPFSLAAILILLLNDHLLRQLYPSWLSGKLGDFAWLFFFPFALAALLAWVVPGRLPRQVQITGLLAFGLTGSVFALAKTLPFFHSAVVQIASLAFGFQVGWVRDPSDLIALSALAAGWLLWQRGTAPQLEAATSRQKPAWLLLTAAVLLTVANAPAPESGIGCLRQANDQVLACSTFGCYASQDGGLSWIKSSDELPEDCPYLSWYGDVPKEQVIQDPADSAIQYRYTPGVSIERSTDGGVSWQLEHELRPVKQAERAYSIKTHANNAVVFNPPLDALADPASRNVLFAMGFSGVLVRQTDGTYINVAVGEFAPDKPSFGRMLFSVLSGEMILALIFGGLGIATISLPQKKHWLRITALILGWLAWAVTSIYLAPAIEEGGYAAALLNMGTLAAGVLALVLAVEALIRKGAEEGKLALRLGLLLFLSAVLYFLPFVLWLMNLLPVYTLALVFGVVLGGGLLAANIKKVR
jgi:hypothetical protein